MGNHTKKEAIKIVTSCAKAYKENLAGKNLLFLCLDKNKKVYFVEVKYSLQGTTQGRYLTGGVPPVRFSM